MQSLAPLMGQMTSRCTAEHLNLGNFYRSNVLTCLGAHLLVEPNKWAFLASTKHNSLLRCSSLQFCVEQTCVIFMLKSSLTNLENMIEIMLEYVIEKHQYTTLKGAMLNSEYGLHQYLSCKIVDITCRS